MQTPNGRASLPDRAGGLDDHLANAAARVEQHLAATLNARAESGVPERLVAAMRHAVLGGGKRFRPFLVLETAGLFSVPIDSALDAACALELIHCYSLVHDDLPAMDNDQLRRGRPTVWAAYDEWTAILVGDALQTLAFELLAQRTSGSSPETQLNLVTALAKAAGAAGMVGGQALDLEADKLGTAKTADANAIMHLQALKTGRLISVACEMGGLIGQASTEQLQALRRYGDALGLAFQISDDLLDAEGSTATVGKTTGKDADAGKATLVSLIGLEAARARLDATIAEAGEALVGFGDRARVLVDAASFLARRKT